jgi:putative membrane protein
MIICMVMMVRMMSHGTHGSHTGERRGQRPDEVERILAERLARGEIDIEEYERRVAVLQRSRQPDRT